ncbi:hypothetical protein M0G43_06545 [Subsaxibacter sp. CAU 1640]|uniref:hypothetical protein n=1 Tax=Subsaxibacter sp. CAU 1640 TaxID=2933271 RepID=UPI0020065FDD|nr:hypothetical protein [Subsaxibacter sp. CAU 1640]MCK7590224.1 hypothetical protein [Subsaxibacter sp. CAU 1640]
METQKIIIIAGMHRSGTSLTASLLQKSGLKIGDRLMTNGFDNIKGHFEDLELLRIHESDLNAKSLDTRGLRGEIKSSLNFEPKTLNEIEHFLQSKKHLSVWGWKEPRTTLYLNAWKRSFPSVKCIAVFRHYDEVADSLLKRYHHKLMNGVGMGKIVRIRHFIIYPINIFLLRYNAYKAWYIYNSSITKFKDAYPNDMIIIELGHFTKNYNRIIKHINSQFATDFSVIDVKEVIEHGLLTKRRANFFRIRLFSHRKLRRMMRDLNEKSLWI